jgi:hypothetical protein
VRGDDGAELRLRPPPDFADTAPGNLHANHVLPRKTLQLVDAGVFWPLRADPLFRLPQ